MTQEQAYYMLNHWIENNMDKLTSKQRTALSMRLGLETGKPMLQKDIGKAIQGCAPTAISSAFWNISGQSNSWNAVRQHVKNVNAIRHFLRYRNVMQREDN